MKPKHLPVRVEGQLQQGPSDTFEPWLDLWMSGDSHAPGMVLICPGGGYERRSDREAEPVAEAWLEAGWNAAVLHYSVGPRPFPRALQELSHAMALLRQTGQERIGVMGFSAGGHLAAMLGVHWNKDFAWAPGSGVGATQGGATCACNRPDALMLGYPVVSMREFPHPGSRRKLLGDAPAPDLVDLTSAELHAGHHCPPLFLWHTAADASVPVEHSLALAQAWRRAGLEFELHVYPHGRHGLSLATPAVATDDKPADPHVATWFGLCREWLDRIPV